MTNYEKVKEAVMYAHVKPELLTDILMEINDLQDIGGVLAITGTVAFDSTLTADTTGITNNTGTLAYVWKRGATTISGAVATTYKLVAADIGSKISCTVTSDVEGGSVTGTTATAVTKKAGGTAPSDLTGGAGTITGLSAALIYEYKAALDETYTAVAPEATSITELTAGDYHVRIAETATQLPSADATVTVTEAPVAVTGVTLAPATLNLTAGGATGTLTETVSPAEATNKEVTWSSDNETVATVANGVVTPLIVGIATITVTTVDGAKTATSAVTVE